MRPLTKEQYEYLADFTFGVIEYEDVEEFPELTYELIREGWIRLVINEYAEEVEAITDSGLLAVRVHQVYLATQ
jgi:hypothetical protein